MQHNREALAAADLAVTRVLAGGNIDEVIGQITDDDALSGLLDQNVKGVIISSIARDDTLHVVVKTAMLYGFLWGHRVASDAYNPTAVANMNGW